MFTMPPGAEVEETIDVNGLFPFEHGVVTTWIGRRRTPAGHRLVRGRRCIGWVAEDDKGLVFGAVAAARLASSESEADHVRHQAQSYSLNELAALVAIMPHAAVHAVDIEGLPSGPGPARRSNPPLSLPSLSPARNRRRVAAVGTDRASASPTMAAQSVIIIPKLFSFDG